MKVLLMSVVALSVMALPLAGCTDAGFANAAAEPVASAAPSSESASAKQSAAPIAERNGNWLIVPSESHIKFSAKQEGEPFTGSFERFSGYIQFLPEQLDASSVRIEIPIESISAGTKDRDNTLPGKVWFSTKAFPKAVFEASDFSRISGNDYVATGTLTMKGKTLPLELPFNLDINNGRAVMTATPMLDRTKWDVGADPWNTDEWVSTGVALDIRVVATDPR